MEYIVYGLPLAVFVAWFYVRRHRMHHVSVVARKEAEEAGLTEPASLHPVIDVRKCIGCGSCIKECPEMPGHTVLGLVGGKATLVSPTECIGHSACERACPVGAIQLVLGTERRGVELPMVTPWFESNVPGVFVAGELGGMGLIRNAIEQGRQAVEQIAQRRPKGRDGALDLLIVGAGPAGFSASLAAMSAKLNFRTVEQESLGGCVFQYPRGKIVMTQPAELPLIGKFKLSLTSKEALLDFWKDAQQRVGLELSCGERVLTVTREGAGFVVTTTRGEHRAASVLLAIGRRGTPRKLGVPGEDLPKVVYRLIDPDQYAGQRVLVVGGGDSALEAAASLAEASADVTLSYRGEAFQRAKTRNRQRVEAGTQSGRLQLLLKSEVKAIKEDRVAVVQVGRGIHVPNDHVIVNAGGILPTDFLKGIGIDIVTKWGTA